jgi:hypothetical protein
MRISTSWSPVDVYGVLLDLGLASQNAFAMSTNTETLSPTERYELITRNLGEVLGSQELLKLCQEEGRIITCYWGEKFILISPCAQGTDLISHDHLPPFPLLLILGTATTGRRTALLFYFPFE